MAKAAKVFFQLNQRKARLAMLKKSYYLLGSLHLNEGSNKRMNEKEDDYKRRGMMKWMKH